MLQPPEVAVREMFWVAAVSMLSACGEPVGITYEAELATISGSPFGLTSDANRTQAVTGSFSWHTGALETEAGEYPHQGQGGFSAELPNGVVISGSTFATVEVDGTTFRFRDGIDVFGDGQPLLVDGTETASAELSLSMVHSDAVFSANRTLPSPFPDLNADNWTHTFSLQDGDSTALLQFTQLSELSQPE